MMKEEDVDKHDEKDKEENEKEDKEEAVKEAGLSDSFASTFASAFAPFFDSTDFIFALSEALRRALASSSFRFRARSLSNED